MMKNIFEVLVYTINVEKPILRETFDSIAKVNAWISNKEVTRIVPYNYIIRNVTVPVEYSVEWAKFDEDGEFVSKGRVREKFDTLEKAQNYIQDSALILYEGKGFQHYFSIREI